VALIAGMLVVANVIAAFIAASRAIFSAGREGLLPRRLAALDKRQQPLVAMTCTYAVFLGVIALSQAAALDIAFLLQLAGQNFFFLYLCAALGYARLAQGARRRWVACIAVASVLAMMLLFSPSGLIYCALLAVAGFALGAGKDPVARPV
jgi:amino acid transporter